MTLVRSALHHSHSRSRNLLSLPLYPSSPIAARRRKKELAALSCPLGNAFRSALLLMLAAFSFFTLDVLHSTSVQSAWNVIIPISGTIPQPVSSFMAPPSIAALHNQSDPPLAPSTHPLSEQPSPMHPARSQPPQPPQPTPAAPQPAPPAESPQALENQSTTAHHTQTQAAQPNASAPPSQSEHAEQHQQQQQPQPHPPESISMEDAIREARLAAHNQRHAADLSNFDRTTALNYFHLHKTGGVSFKERLYDFVTSLPPNAERGASSRTINIMDTCHTSGPARPALGAEAEWSCDWGSMQQLSERDRNNIDLIVGHQYWHNGAEYWLPKRDLRFFTVMRHPLHRKISFFYHFFVRNVGRDEQSVQLHELISFVLGKNMPHSPLIRDAGPNYYASRLCSDGFSGFSEHVFVVPQHKAGEVVFESVRKLRRRFVFIGLQTQEKASLCMLKKSVAALSKAHGVPHVKGLDVFEKTRERMNAGSYPLSARIVWQKMSEQQRNEFKQVEKVDLAIYKESVNMFDEMVRKFECRHLVQANDEQLIAL